MVTLPEGTVRSAVQWMPDGHHIMYFGEGGAGHWHVVDIGGLRRRRIFGDHAFNQVSVAPDGAHFAVTTLENDYGFRIVTEEGQTVEELAASYRYAGAPTWSPDGDCIAFSAAADEEATASGLYVLLYVLTRATGSRRSRPLFVSVSHTTTASSPTTWRHCYSLAIVESETPQIKHNSP